MQMETEMEVERNKEQLATLKHSMSLSRWIGEQLTILAEAFGEPMTPQRLKIYAEDLVDIGQERLTQGFTHARRECRFFPRIAELRELAGVKAQDQRMVEAEAAWTWANDYLRKWGVDRMCVYSGGKRLEAPAIPPRIEYALRRIGGLWGLNQITAESRPFVQKDFIEAYFQAPMAEAQAPQLDSMFGPEKLLGEVKQLAAGKPIDAPTRAAPDVSCASQPTVKRVPRPLSEVEARDRREILRQQSIYLVTHSKTSR
jgi:hypothetical protein